LGVLPPAVYLLDLPFTEYCYIIQKRQA